MSGLSYKELQEKGVFDVPYKAFEFMQSQQAEIDQLKAELALCREENKGLIKSLNKKQIKIDELENQVQSARVLCETACELLADYSHQDAMMILDDLEKNLRGERESK